MAGKENFFLSRPIFSTVISLVIMLLGALALRVLPVAQFPEMIPPQIVVSASYPGASAETIAQTVAAPLEVQINGVDNMLYMSSISSGGNGSMSINVFFAVGTDPDMAQVMVNNRVQIATAQLPEEVRRLGVSVIKRAPAILLMIILTSPDNRYDEVFLHNYMALNIQDEIKRVPGVGDATIFGYLDYSMRIWLQPDKLAHYRLTPGDVRAAVQDQNMQFSPGRLGDMPSSPDAELNLQIDAKGRLSSEEEFRDIIIRAEPDGTLLRLGDVARVELGGKDYTVMSQLNGSPARTMGVFLSPGANALATGTLVQAKIEELSKNFPEGVAYTVPFDTNRFVRVSIQEVAHTLGIAIVLVVLVVFLFLQSWRATLIPCLAVPVAIVGSFAGMYALGFTINTLTLFGMVLAIGIVVDDAIVVLENVERVMDKEKLPPKQAIVKAMNEVTSPVIAIVLVLCATFLPVSFLGGLAGQMYRQFAVTIAISAVISGIVALTLTPALCGLLLKPHAHNEQKPLFFRWFNNAFALTTRRYVRLVYWVKNSTVRSLCIFAVILLVLGSLLRQVPGGLVPAEDQGFVLGLTILPDGAALPRTIAVQDRTGKILADMSAVENVMSINGIDITTFSAKSNYSTRFIVLKDWDLRKKPSERSEAVARSVRAFTALEPEAVILGLNPSPIPGMSMTGGFEGYLQQRGRGTLAELNEWANKLQAAAAKRPELAGVQNLFSMNAPGIYLDVDRERCRAMGVPVSDVFTALGSTFGTMYINDFNLYGRTYQVRMNSDVEYRMVQEHLNEVYVRGSKGDMIPVSTLMNLERRVLAPVVERFNIFPSAHILGAAAPGYSSGQALAAMEELAKEVLPPDYVLSWSGQALQEKLAGSSTTMIFFLAILMVFLILAAQYESWSLPLAVITAVPFGVFGAVTAIWLRGMNNDVYFQIALVTLVGLAAKNAILIVEFAAEAMRAGYTPDTAALRASRLRFRPIIMTSLAFIAGCLPLAVSSGAGANSRHAIGTAVIGGMLAATCIATLFVPFFFKNIIRVSQKFFGTKFGKEHK
jgi:multidrug efflux pump